MDWIRKEVPSFELCKELKKLGYPQEGTDGFWWVTTLTQDWHISCGIDAEWKEENKGNYIKAPTCRELGEWLPDLIIFKHKGKEWWCIHHTITKESNVKAYTEANARAKLLIWLVKNGYVKFD